MIMDEVGRNNALIKAAIKQGRLRDAIHLLVANQITLVNALTGPGTRDLGPGVVDFAKWRDDR